MSEKTDETLWYENGLRFECTGCGQCCTGAPGYVWVNRQEIGAMARALGAPVEEFERKYVRQVGIRKSLVERANGDCIFFDNRSRRCRVYAVRPRQCRSWPFWDSNVQTPEAWQQTCRVCPGCGQGRLIPAATIDAQRRLLRL